MSKTQVIKSKKLNMKHPSKQTPPEVPEKGNKEKEDEHETPLETDPLHVPETDTLEQETEKETPLEESPHDVPEKDKHNLNMELNPHKIVLKTRLN